MSDPFKDTRDPLVRSMERAAHTQDVETQKAIVVRMRKLNSQVIAERDALAAELARCRSAIAHDTQATRRIADLEAALRNLNDTVKSMRNPQTLADVALLLFKFNGPVFVADQLLGSVAETSGVKS